MKRILFILCLVMNTTVATLATTPLFAQSIVDWDNYLEAAGVNEVLDQANNLIDQEINNLGKTPLGFTREQLRMISNQFRERLSAERLRQDIVSQLEAELSMVDIAALDSLLSADFLRHLQSMQANLEDADVRQAMRAYRQKLRSLAPNSNRVELVTHLDQVLQQSTLETELKVELRKQLLAVVSKMKSNEVYSETLLDKQLHQYRQTVEGEISENAMYAYMFLLKQTPSSEVRDWLVTLQQPVFEEFMAICQRSIRKSFAEARRQLLTDARLASQ